MRRWSSAGAIALLLAAAPARAAASRRVYDPEIALLLIDVQRQSVTLVREEMLRQAEWLGLGGMQVLLPAKMDAFEARVRRRLTVDSDVVEEYRRAIVDMSPGDAGEADRLVAEIRRYHGLRPGPPLERVPLPPVSGPGPKLLAESGVGSDAEAALAGSPLLDEPVAYAERRFGSTGPFLRRRKWNLDFYLGSFSDLIPQYRRLGYRRVYRLRAPYVSFGRRAYVLAPEPGLRPRLVYCSFYGADLFLNTRAQWAVLTRAARGQGPIVRTLTCPSCRWSPRGVSAMRDLLATVPYPVDEVVVGYDDLFARAWKDRLLGIYQNDYWRLGCYRSPAGVVATLQPRHTDYGEILAASLEPLIRRGARAVFYGGPAAAVDPRADTADLALPTAFVSDEGKPIPFVNALRPPRRRPLLFGGLPTPLFATREWLAAARKRGVSAFDGEMARLAEAAVFWRRPDGTPVSLGIGAVLGGLSDLHPEEDRTFYTLEYANQVGRESAKRQFLARVVAALKAAARDKSR